ncbi:hypothetical protein F0562_001646 [Nyssa sinensis]|uniref:WRKY domain-containing protein n=1 Tax=Nyssa sinensis TaxID=561372 RepID=A0A5J5C4P8_9ASTE|nr:hypothetical protein F0562_001646 [Nyssa sinensis]
MKVQGLLNASEPMMVLRLPCRNSFCKKPQIISILLCILPWKLRIKRKIRVPAASNKLADIPPDDYTWRKYGQKPIKGSPHPRPTKCYLGTMLWQLNYTMKFSNLSSHNCISKSSTV